MISARTQVYSNNKNNRNDILNSSKIGNRNKNHLPNTLVPASAYMVWYIAQGLTCQQDTRVYDWFLKNLRSGRVRWQGLFLFPFYLSNSHCDLRHTLCKLATGQEIKGTDNRKNWTYVKALNKSRYSGQEVGAEQKEQKRTQWEGDAWRRKKRFIQVPNRSLWYLCFQ